jgi:hypothetical protein
MRYALALFAVLALAYCAQPEKPVNPAPPPAPAEAPAPPPAPVLNSVEAIDLWFKGIQENEASLTVSENAVTRGDSPATKLKTFKGADGKPVIIKAELMGDKIPNMQEYYLDANGKLVLLRELIMAGVTNTENRFYYNNGKLIKALGRTIKGRMAWDSVPFGDYVSKNPELDFRLNAVFAQESADNYLKGK